MNSRTSPDLTSLVSRHRIVVCVGSGGVGKTTVAAALALWGALHGQRTAVLTIDPAKRLATCLGLEGPRAQQEQPLPPEAFAPYGLSPTGTLTAVLVDQQSAWDAVIKRYAPTPEIHNHILANRFYLGLSRTFAGSHEYMALDTLATLAQRGVYDLIVVDTPPTKQALDFLEAPQRIQRFLDSQVSKWFIQPSVATGWAAFSAVNRTAAFLLRKIEAATGVSALGDISEFFTAMQQMLTDFGYRFTQVSQLLTSQETAFLLITRSEEEVLTETAAFLTDLHRLKVPLKGVVVNGVQGEWQTVPAWNADAGTLVTRLQSVLQMRPKKIEQIEWLVKNFLAYQTVGHGEKRRLEHLQCTLSQETSFTQVPIVPALPADLSGLLTLHQYLFAPPIPQPQHRAQAKGKKTRREKEARSKPG
jgi:anion-transporting  ArsA/GET3 family ATPase